MRRARLLEGLEEHRSLLSMMLIAFLFLNATLRSWRAWGDPVIDFPSQLYTAWRVAEGDLLYRDIFHFYGPISQLLHGALFKLFGAGYIVLSFANLLNTLLIAFLILRLLSTVFGTLTGVMAATAFLLIHAFQNIGITSAFSFVAPYSHEATHGILLILILTTAALAVTADSGRHRWFLLGLLTSLCWLTKPEFMVAASAILLIQFGLTFWRANDLPWVSARRAAAASFAGMLLPQIATFAYFLFREQAGLHTAARRTLGAIDPLLTTSITSNPIYERILGSDSLVENAIHLSGRTLLVALLLAPALALDTPRFARVRKHVGLAYVGVLLAALQFFPLLGLARAWPVLATIGTGFVCFLLVKKTLPDVQTRLATFLSVTAVILSLKNFLHATFHWLGFYLTLPATLLITALGVGVVPAVLRQRSPGAFVFRWSAVVLLGSMALQAARSSAARYDLCSVPLGEGRDRMYVSAGPGFPIPGSMMREVVLRVQEHTPHGTTLVAIPEGLLINYLLRRPNPTPFATNYVSQSLFLAAGESAVLSSLAAAPPDHIIYLRRPPEMPGPEYRMRGEGGYANAVFTWIEANYEEVDRIGPATHNFADLGYVLLQRRTR